jgi:hypothetical protein
MFSQQDKNANGTSNPSKDKCFDSNKRPIYYHDIEDRPNYNPATLICCDVCHRENLRQCYNLGKMDWCIKCYENIRKEQ